MAHSATQSANERGRIDLIRALSDAAQALIEKKHLYQRVTVDAVAILQECPLGQPNSQVRVAGR
jgi:hypothetical protein